VFANPQQNELTPYGVRSIKHGRTLFREPRAPRARTTHSSPCRQKRSFLSIFLSFFSPFPQNRSAIWLYS